MGDGSDWYSYHWELEGQPAEFHVDLRYAESFDSLGDFTTLLCTACFPLRPDAEAFTGWERRKLPRALEACQKALGQKAVLVGYVDLPAERRSCFYASDARLLVPLLNVCQANRDFQMECVKASEPERETYYQLLYPDRAKRQSVDNARYIQAMKGRGDCLTAQRRVNLHLQFPSDRSRAQFAEEAKSMGFAIGRDDYVPEQAMPYLLVLHAISPLTEASVTVLTTKAVYGAEAYGGDLDRVDSFYVPKRSWL